VRAIDIGRLGQRTRNAAAVLTASSISASAAHPYHGRGHAESEFTVSQDWPRPVVHWELVASDPARLATFYRELFNWQIGEGAVMQISAGLGGPEPGPAGHLRSGDHPGVSLFVQVRNIAESLTRAEALGGRRLREPYATPTGITLASILDPEGNRVVLVQQ
jgi:uncharacterized protein